MNNKDYRNRIMKKAGVLLLSVIMAVTMMPVFAFAENPVIPVTDNKLQADTPAADEPAASAASDTSASIDSADTQQTDPVVAETVQEPQETAETAEPVTEQSETSEEETGVIASSLNLTDSDDLLAGYIEEISGVDISTEEGASQQTLEDAMRKTKLMARRAVLNENGQKLYDALKTGITAIAEGSTDETYVDVVMAKEDFDNCAYRRVINALISDHPYELYWCDKTIGALSTYSYDTGTVHVYFAVSADYRTPEVLKTFTYKDAEGNEKIFEVHNTDLNKTRAANNAVNNAKSIVSKYADLSDVAKLYSYKDEICALTDYNYGTSGADYGDPWQIINVFDGNPETKVVCEGYAKAFKFLCDASSFSSPEIECNTITGYYGTGRVPHMWNAMHMDDGLYYIADVTQCDEGAPAYPDQVFLTGCSKGTVDAGYEYLVQPNRGATANGTNDSTAGTTTLTYTYDNTALGLYTPEELSMSFHDLVSYVKASPAKCTAAGNTEYWSKGGKCYTDRYCSKEIPKANTAVKALGHSWYVSYKALDYNTQKCRRCGVTRKVSKVVVDRPKLTIKAPSRAKKAFTAKWKKLSAANRKKVDGIEIQYSTNKSFTDSASVVRTAKKTAASKKITKLGRKKTYYVRVRTYKWISGKKHVSKWSSVKKVKTK